jgi:putative ABC transport system substrate-binding protein
MTRRPLLAAIAGAVATALTGTADAQAAPRPVRIGVLYLGKDNPLLAVLVAALRELGWVEGTNTSFEFRASEGDHERFRELAVELVARNVDVVVTIGGASATLAAKAATTTIPIVFINSADPIKFGLVASLARPEANVTGIAIPEVDWGKWLQIAHEVVPAATRIAVIGNSTNLTYAHYAAQNQAAAERLGLQLQMLPLARVDDFGDVFAAMRQMRAEVLVFGPDGPASSSGRRVARRTLATGRTQLLRGLGAIASYGFDARGSVRRGAQFVDRILRGATPAQLPVEQPARFELVVNVVAAKGLGLTLPASLLVQADEVLR